MQAQRARCYAVNSYESKGAIVPALIRGDKRAFHESRVCVELIRSGRTGFGIHSRSAEGEVDLADKPFKVRDRGGVAPFRVRACAVCRRC